jgi:hypothetical protein
VSHTHHCVVCNMTVAICSEACVHEGDHYCSVHHPDPAKRHNPAPVARMNVRVVSDAIPDPPPSHYAHMADELEQRLKQSEK